MTGILDRELVNQAFEIVQPAVLSLLHRGVTAKAGIAVVVTAVNALRPWNESSGTTFADGCLLVASIGNLDQSRYPNMEIALSKACLSARTGLPTADLPPQYLRPGDTIYWGSVVLEGIVVACAGLEEHHDEMCAHWLAATIRALAKQRVSEFRRTHPDASFLT